MYNTPNGRQRPNKNDVHQLSCLKKNREFFEFWRQIRIFSSNFPITVLLTLAECYATLRYATLRYATLRYATLYIRFLKKKIKKKSKKNSKISVNFFFQMFCAYGLPRPICHLPANIFFLGPAGLGGDRYRTNNSKRLRQIII
jgi:hypothetical protein